MWKKPNDTPAGQDVKGTVRFRAGSVKLWRCIKAQRVGYTSRIDSRMDAQLYTEILGDEFLETLRDDELDVDEIVFQQDNHPKRTSSIARKWFEHNDDEVLEWLAQSVDLNPIEHMWQRLKRQLAAYDAEPPVRMSCEGVWKSSGTIFRRKCGLI
jgi:hypothetical protein